MRNEDDVTGIAEGERDRTVENAHRPRGKRLTPEKTLDRITRVTSLEIATVLLFTGVILSILYALLWYDYITNWQVGDHVNWFHRHGSVLIYFTTLGVALIAGYTAASIAYRPRFDELEDGEVEKRSLEFPEEGVEGIISRLCQLAVPVFSLLMLLSLIYLFLGFYTGREDYNFIEGYKTVYLYGILHSLIFPLLPGALLLLFLSGPRGLKRLDLYTPFLLVAGICMIMSVIFSLYLHTELYLYYSDLDEGNWLDAEMSEFAMNYAGEISTLFELGVFFIGAIIISNMRFKRSSQYRFEPTPGMILFLAGFLVLILAVIIELTIFNPDFEYSGDTDGWGGWYYFLGSAGRIILYGAFLLLMVEYSLSRRISKEHVALEPGELWGEIREQNPIISSRMS